MKKLKYSILLLALLTAVGTFVACGDDEEDASTETQTEVVTEAPASFGDIYNGNFDHLEDVPAAMTTIPELKDYRVMDLHEEEVVYYGTPEFTLLYKDDENTGNRTYKVFSHFKGEIVATFATNSTETTRVDYQIQRCNETYLFKVTKSVYDLVADKTTYTYSLYDLTGQAVVERSRNFDLDDDVLYRIGNDVVFENTVYALDEKTGALTKKGSLPINFNPSDDSAVTACGDFFYEMSDNQLYISDKNFQVVATWYAPANALNSQMFVLANGDVLIQYIKELHPDVTSYDIYEQRYGQIQKYDMITELFSLTDKTSKTLDFDYYVETCYNHFKIEEDIDQENICAEGFENILTVRALVEQKISASYKDMDYLAFSNDGKLGASYKLVEDQLDMPVPYMNGNYYVRTTYGAALVDAGGKVIKQIMGDLEAENVGNFFVTDYGIYDASFELIYNFAEKNAVYHSDVDNTIFVRQYADNDTDYSIIAFRDGKTATVFEYTKEGAETEAKRFGSSSRLGLYWISNITTGDVTYYNADGTKLLTVAGSIGDTYYGYDGNAVLAAIENNGQVDYYVIK